MNAETAELLDSDLLKDAEATAQRPALAPSDEIQTAVRLPAITPPPPAPATATMPLPAVSFPPQSRVPTMPAHRPEVAASRPSWLQALLATTFPPPAATLDPEAARLARRRAGAGFVGLALAFAFVAMVTGLRGAPDDPSIAPVVAAALVLSHALVALGAGAFSFGLLRMAERLLRD